MNHANSNHKLRGRFVDAVVLGILFATLSCAGSEKISSVENDSLEKRVEKLETALPGVGEIMTNVQLHFSKLYFAANAKNWDLASFEIDEIEENLAAAVSLRHEERGVRLDGVFDAFKNTELKAMKEAVSSKDMEAFRHSYHESMKVCNSCHNATGRPFIVITTPTGPPVTNQLWKPLFPQK